MQAALYKLYTYCGVAAAVSLLAILLLVVTQMAARWSGLAFPGSTDYAGYCMGAATYFALAYTLAADGHIRVRMVLNRLGAYRRWMELWCYAIGSILSLYFCYYSIKANYLSYLINDISQGQDATPLWIPQLTMSAGTIILTIAMLHGLLLLLFSNRTLVDTEANKKPE